MSMPTTDLRIVTPVARVLRSLAQVLATLVPTIPIVFAGLPGDLSDTAVAGWTIGIFGGIYLLVVALQNALEGRGGDTPLFGTPVASSATVPVVVVTDDDEDPRSGYLTADDL